MLKRKLSKSYIWSNKNIPMKNFFVPIVITPYKMKNISSPNFKFANLSDFNKQVFLSENLLIIHRSILHHALHTHQSKPESSSFFPSRIILLNAFSSSNQDRWSVYCTQQFFLLFNFLFSQECDRTCFRKRFTIGYSMVITTHIIYRQSVVYVFRSFN